MNSYGVKDVEKLLRLPRSTINALIKAGFVSPERGPRREWQFSFQDLIVLRTAQALADAKVPSARITRSLEALRAQLPEKMPLSGLSISAAGNHVVIREGAGQRRVDSGQYLLAFEGNPDRGTLRVDQSRAWRAPTKESDDDPYELGLTLEQSGDREAAIKAYERAIADDPKRLDARINLGRLLHEAGRLAQAEVAYRAAVMSCGEDAVLMFNLGVLLEDRGRSSDAIKAYEAALAGDSGLADCHYNLSLLFQKLRRPKDALRHMSQYKRLMRSVPR